MAQFTLPKNSQISEGKTWPAPQGDKPSGLPDLPLEPG